MSLHPIPAPAALAAYAGYGAIIDARSPAEFAEDHLPGAVNWPVLDNEQRIIVGTTYVQVSALEARKIGAAMVARNIADHLDREMSGLPKDWRPLVYCWRGGQRSGSLAWFLSQIGFRTAQLQGGYKAFRAVVREQLAPLSQALSFTVLCGRTGSGKTRLLQALARQGEQVLDLEALACHRGSVLGAVQDQPQPTQKGFETRLWQALRGFDPARPVWVENESAKIGVLRVPEPLLAHMQARGRCVQVRLSDPERVRLLLEDYAQWFTQPEAFCSVLDGLIELRGRETVGRWQALARAGRWAECFALLMAEHYDPLYDRSTRRHFGALADAPEIAVASSAQSDFDAAAVAWMRAAPPSSGP
ncbi:tRNA 2-selenouridine(34) synthase MnmH [Pseudaquabacterium rugosum]|uniref:tRNA 2-selenouridine(34) synthase MnmH n=1 Tax=Pseudaquabacterium rugosum TaxID=2984194 RepID=A0ABU9B981_9BURK